VLREDGLLGHGEAEADRPRAWQGAFLPARAPSRPGPPERQGVGTLRQERTGIWRP
jgi:hypothetical protein